jgi:hypothetical protein
MIFSLQLETRIDPRHIIIREIILKKYLPLLLLSHLALLAACGPGASPPTTTALPIPEPSPTTFQESACQSINLEPTPDAKESSLFPPVTENDYAVGPKDASMTMIEYGDFQ